MAKSQVFYIAASLDGYIATEDDSLEWLFKVEGEGDNGYSAFYETVDTIIMGKRTYDWILEHDIGGFPYKNKECYVFTRSEQDHNENVQFVQGHPSRLIENLKKQEGQSIWLVGGGDLIAAFLQEKLIDEMMITIAPSLIGRGIPLFKKGNYSSELKLKDTTVYNQFVTLHYEVKH